MITSIIVPIHNTNEKLVKRCVDSIYNQTISDYEILLCFNGCSKEYISSIKETLKDYRIKVVLCDSIGVSAARNTGLNAATGDYVMFVDADDELKKSFLEKAVMLLNNDKQLDIVSAGIRKIYRDSYEDMCYRGERFTLFEKEDLLSTVFFPERIDSFSKLAGYYFTSPCGKLYRKTLLDTIRFDEKLHHIEDMTFNLEALLCCNRVGIMPDVGYMYYQYSGSAIHTFDERMVANNYEVIYELSRISKCDNRMDKHKWLYVAFSIKMIWESIEHTRRYSYYSGYMKDLYESEIFMNIVSGYASIKNELTKNERVIFFMISHKLIWLLFVIKRIRHNIYLMKMNNKSADVLKDLIPS